MLSPVQNKDRHLTRPKPVRLTPTNQAFVEKCQKDFHLKGFNETLNHVLEKASSQGIQEQVVNVQLCEYLSGIPSHPDWIDCKKERGRTIRKLLVECMVCKLSRTADFPLTTVEKLKDEVKKLREERETLKAEVLQTDQETVRGMKSTIADLRDHVKNANAVIKDKDEEIDWLRMDLGACLHDNDFLREGGIQALREVNRIHELHDIEHAEFESLKRKQESSSPIPNEMPSIERSVEKPASIERTTEKIETKIETRTTEKSVYAQPTESGGMVQCSLKNERVSVAEDCMHKCQDFPKCKQYMELYARQKQ